MHGLDPCPMPSTLQAPAKRELQPQHHLRHAGTAAGLISKIVVTTDEGANGMNRRTTGPLTPRKLFIWIRSTLLVRIAAAWDEAVGSTPWRRVGPWCRGRAWSWCRCDSWRRDRRGR